MSSYNEYLKSVGSYIETTDQSGATCTCHSYVASWLNYIAIC